MSLWDELRTEFYREQQKIPRGLHLLAAPATLPEAILEAQTTTHESLDLAVFVYSETGAWPALSAVERTMLGERLLYAIEVISLLLDLPRHRGRLLWPPPEPPLPRAELIRWLLTEVWHDEGFPTIHSMSDALRPAPPSDSPRGVSLN